MTLKRLLVVIAAVWVLLVVVSFVAFNIGEDDGGDGRGDTIEQPASP